MAPPNWRGRWALAEAGYVDGQTARLEWRWTGGRVERVAGLIDELVRLPADIIVVSGNPVALAARQVTRLVPIVMASSWDPVGQGLAHRAPGSGARSPSG